MSDLCPACGYFSLHGFDVCFTCGMCDGCGSCDACEDFGEVDYDGFDDECNGCNTKLTSDNDCYGCGLCHECQNEIHCENCAEFSDVGYMIGKAIEACDLLVLKIENELNYIEFGEEE